jgi:AMMECR1 domain-containing protein
VPALWAAGEQLRETLNKQAKKDKEGNPAYKLSVNDFIIKASGGCTRASRRLRGCVGVLLTASPAASSLS